MTGYQTDFQLGSLKLPNNILCAPLAGYTDQPFRQLCRDFFSGLIFCEMVKIEAVVRKIPATLRYLDFVSSEHPIGAQLCGSQPEVAKQAAKIIEDMGFDLIDLNCGCPVDKVTKDGSGSAMLKNPDLIGEVLSAIVGSVDLPVTVKIRMGWNEEQVNAPEIVKIAEQAGAKAVIIHGRTRAQGYRGGVNLKIIKDCKQAARKIKVIGNGNLFYAEDVFQMFEETDCDGVMLSRGMIGQPWIFQEIAKYPNFQIRSTKEIKETLLNHFFKIQKYQKIEKKAVFDMRRLAGWYLKFCSYTKALRIGINQTESVAEIFHLIENYPWDTVVYQKKEKEVKGIYED